jgi:hypothetical protein
METGKKYRFRKVYFQCADKKVMEPHHQFTNAYQYKEHALKNFEARETHMLWEDKSKPLPKRSVEGFYLVHESLFDEILKKHSKE